MYNPTESHYSSRNQDPPVSHPYVWMKDHTLAALGPENRVYQEESLKNYPTGTLDPCEMCTWRWKTLHADEI